jgi:hypothetical protein
MTVEHVELLVEEPSMEAFLRGILPRILKEVSFEVYPSQSKKELLLGLPARLRAYAKWLPDSWRLVIVVDRDQDDCHKLKYQLESIAETAGLMTRSKAAAEPFSVVNRLAIEELEAWYFGDWQAVCKAFPNVPPTIPTRRNYRDPDGVRGGTWETFERILVRAGYFEGGLRKIEAARTIARHADPSRNRSRSFKSFYGALVEMVDS